MNRIAFAMVGALLVSPLGLARDPTARGSAHGPVAGPSAGQVEADGTAWLPVASRFPPNKTFSYSTGFFHQTGGVWVEEQTDERGTKSTFSEVSCTTTYVQLYDRQRDMYVRLYGNVGKWSKRASGPWVKWPGSEGRWVSSVSR